jgi:hypothetical protein
MSRFAPFKRWGRRRNSVRTGRLYNTPYCVDPTSAVYAPSKFQNIFLRSRFGSVVRQYRGQRTVGERGKISICVCSVQHPRKESSTIANGPQLKRLIGLDVRHTEHDGNIKLVK